MSHLSTLDVHRYQLGELHGPALDAAREHLASCDRCQRRLEAAAAQDQAVAEAPLPAWLSEAPAPRPSPAAWGVWLRRMAPASTALLAAAAMLMMALPVARMPEGEGVRTKGDLPAMELWIQAEGGPRPLEVGEALDAGDRVQLFYDPRGAARVALAGRDGTGAIEVYDILAPARQGLQPAPFALTLDDTPGIQEFFVVTGDPGLDEASAAEAVQAGDPSVRRMVVAKEPPRR